MAVIKETAKQRKEREELEAKFRFVELQKAYPRRLMRSMMDYVQLGQFLVVPHISQPDVYVFYPDPNLSYVDAHFDMPAEMITWDNFYDLEKIEAYVKEYAEAKDEEHRKAQARKDALAKLSKEERELLGV
jgi:hypothetical protein